MAKIKKKVKVSKDLYNVNNAGNKITMESIEDSSKKFHIVIDRNGIINSIELDENGNEITKTYKVITGTDGTILTDNECNILVEEE